MSSDHRRPIKSKWTFSVASVFRKGPIMKITILCVAALILIYFSGFIKGAVNNQKVGAIAEHDAAQASNVTSGLCECAAFPTATPAPDLQPSIAHPTVNVTCDASGEEKCTKMCTALAETAKERGSIVLCLNLGHVVRYKPFVFDRICGSTTWHYTGLTFDLEVCCHEGKPIDCKEAEGATSPPPPPPQKP